LTLQEEADEEVEEVKEEVEEDVEKELQYKKTATGVNQNQVEKNFQSPEQ